MEEHTLEGRRSHLRPWVPSIGVLVSHSVSSSACNATLGMSSEYLAQTNSISKDSGRARWINCGAYVFLAPYPRRSWERLEYHKYQMTETLGLRTNAELIHFAIEHGLVEF